MVKSPEICFHELSFYTLSHPDKAYFIHQHIVDAFTAQTASTGIKPIGLIFSLAGLYLYKEKGYTGRQVQLAHMKLAKGNKEWPPIVLPGDRGEIRIGEVLAANPGNDRDTLIRKWCHCVWEVYHESHPIIASQVGSRLGSVDLQT